MENIKVSTINSSPIRFNILSFEAVSRYWDKQLKMTENLYGL